MRTNSVDAIVNDQFDAESLEDVLLEAAQSAPGQVDVTGIDKTQPLPDFTSLADTLNLPLDGFDVIHTSRVQEFQRGSDSRVHSEAYQSSTRTGSRQHAVDHGER